MFTNELTYLPKKLQLSLLLPLLLAYLFIFKWRSDYFYRKKRTLFALSIIIGFFFNLFIYISSSLRNKHIVMVTNCVHKYRHLCIHIYQLLIDYLIRCLLYCYFIHIDILSNHYHQRHHLSCFSFSSSIIAINIWLNRTRNQIIISIIIIIIILLNCTT